MYGILIALGIFLGLVLAEKLAKLAHKDSTIIWEGAIWLILGGLFGARLYHVIHLWPYYAAAPLRIFYLWNGGLGILGALAGGGLTGIVFLKLNHQDIKGWLDIAAVVLPLGQALGRWGNFFNKELFGSPTLLPWGLYIEPANRPIGYTHFATFHPLFFYESLLTLLLFYLLYSCYKRNHIKFASGSFLAFYLIGYSTLRFTLEFLRIESWRIYGINVAQTICLITFLGAILWLYALHNIRPRRV